VSQHVLSLIDLQWLESVADILTSNLLIFCPVFKVRYNLITTAINHIQGGCLRILHVITGLETGGAERTLLQLIEGGLRDQFDCSVLSLSGEGTYGSLLRKTGIPVHCVHMSSHRPSVRALLEYRRLLQQIKPDVVQGWMYHGNLMASLAPVLATNKPPVVWNIRHALYDIHDERRITRWVIRMCRYLSGRAQRVIYNSTIARRQHESFGFSAHQGVVIPNGFDLEQWRPDVATRSHFRNELNIPGNALVIGHIARFHPLKDHATFLKAMVPVMDKLPSVQLVMIGKGIDAKNSDLAPYLDLLPANRVRLLGERQDVEQLMTTMDVICQSSISEAFPNVLAEAMSTGIPCVATDVGDSALIVGDTGLIVPVKDEAVLSSAIEELITLPEEKRKALGSAARDRIHMNFGLSSSVNQYVTLYEALMGNDDIGTH
jgi:glycosyltransferase involved in cell wall biosynthesis